MTDLDKLEAIARQALERFPSEQYPSPRLAGIARHAVMADREPVLARAVIDLVARIRELETGLHRAVHAGESLYTAYEESHIWSMLNELEKAGALVGRKPGDPSPR
jgi:hypothetical protein